MNEPGFGGKRFLIVGLGLMGGSYAMGLARAGCRVSAIDRDAEAIAWARANGMIALGASYVDLDGSAILSLIGQADYVILALYPGDILPWLAEYGQHLKPGAMLTDMAGVKGSFVREAQTVLGPAHEFIPSHPMAGREVSGVQNADDGIFRGANFIITPTARNTETGMAFARALANVLGFGRITVLPPEDHDKMIGYVSQLTHVIAVCLMNANPDARLPDVTGDSFRDLTRIANINAGMWSELFLENRDNLLAEIDVFANTLQQFRQSLNSCDKENMVELLKSSARLRQRFDAPREK